MALFYWLSSLPGRPTPETPAVYLMFYWVPPSVQNALHIPAYAALAWAWRWALDAWLHGSTTRTIAACVIATVYGGFDEWHQSWVPGRYASVTDVLFDTAGAALGTGLAEWARRYAARSATAIAARDPYAP